MKAFVNSFSETRPEFDFLVECDSTKIFEIMWAMSEAYADYACEEPEEEELEGLAKRSLNKTELSYVLTKVESKEQLKKVNKEFPLFFDCVEESS